MAKPKTIRIEQQGAFAHVTIQRYWARGHRWYVGESRHILAGAQAERLEMVILAACECGHATPLRPTINPRQERVYVWGASAHECDMMTGRLYRRV